MTAARQVMLIALGLLVAAIFQGRLAHSMSFGAAQPDFVLVTLACGAVLAGGMAGIGLGLWGGLLTAALVPMTLGSFLVSRTLAGAFAGWLQGSVIPSNLAVPPLVTLVTTLMAEIVYVLMAPTHHLRAWAAAVGGEILYNMVLAFPIYALLRRLGVGEGPEESFLRHS